MNRVVEGDRAVVPSKRDGAVKLEAFLEETRNGRRAIPTGNRDQLRWNGLMKAVIATLVVVEKRGYGIDAPGSWWKERASVELDAAVLRSLAEAGCRIVRSPPGEGRVWAFLRAGKSRGEGRGGGRGWEGAAPRRGRGAGISPGDVRSAPATRD